MRRMWFVPGPGTITSMINACANAHPSEADYSMQQTKWLLQRERHRYGGIHKVTYFAAMKCFAKYNLLFATLPRWARVISKFFHMEMLCFI